MRRALLPAALLLLASCREPDSQVKAEPRPDTRPLMIAIEDGRGLIFSYFDHRADLRSVERIAQVPEDARAETMITDPTRLLPADNVYVGDLRKRQPGGEYRVWIEPRRSWLDRRMPKTSQLRALARADAPPPEKTARPKRKIRVKRPVKKAAAALGAEPAPARPKVALFSTSWCPSCRAARAHLQSRKVAFVELDVEKDAEAAQQYQAAQTAFRLRPGVVPLILVAGKPLQGFSAAQLDAALAAAGLIPR